MRAPLEPAPVTGAVVAGLRETVAGPGTDRFLAPELQAAEVFLKNSSVAALTSGLPS
jgi:histidine ammonia-lyase